MHRFNCREETPGMQGIYEYSIIFHCLCVNRWESVYISNSNNRYNLIKWIEIRYYRGDHNWKRAVIHCDYCGLHKETLTMFPGLYQRVVY